LDYGSYERLQDVLNSDRLIPKLGEFTSVLHFEPDEEYGFIDMSNIREWKYNARSYSIDHNELFYNSFDEWDSILSSLCHRKTRKGAYIREKIFSDFWQEKVPEIEYSGHWKNKFALAERNEYELDHDGKPERLVSSFYRRLE
ncbi:MAG: hypothetical protein QMD85_03655, partial [Candidatus Aenigmarchaeota archaeon]|nr:hypothetical protein [Candidatus Aenigmarchaeota archaeon]MDI6722651.1 hypothetical protein [Candidatus Aenigmarchaeota archaeon]